MQQALRVVQRYCDLLTDAHFLGLVGACSAIYSRRFGHFLETMRSWRSLSVSTDILSTDRLVPRYLKDKTIDVRADKDDLPFRDLPPKTLAYEALWKWEDGNVVMGFGTAVSGL